VLGAARGATQVREPDNEKLSAPAIWAKQGLGRFPVLGADERPWRYEWLWRWALSGAPAGRAIDVAQSLVRGADERALENVVVGRRSARLTAAGALGAVGAFGRLGNLRGAGGSRGSGFGASTGAHGPASSRSAPSSPVAGKTVAEKTEAGKTVVAKSVHACLALGWLASRFDVEVVVVLRHPANVLSSWLELELPDRDRDLSSVRVVRERFVDRWGVQRPGGSSLERAVWQLGLLTCALEEAISEHPDWQVCTHEQLCTDPEAEFHRLSLAVGLTWGADMSETIERSDKAGSGFAVERQASKMADSWRERLGQEQVETMLRVLEPFPLRTWDSEQLGGGGPGNLDWVDRSRT